MTGKSWQLAILKGNCLCTKINSPAYSALKLADVTVCVCVCALLGCGDVVSHRDHRATKVDDG